MGRMSDDLLLSDHPPSAQAREAHELRSLAVEYLEGMGERPERWRCEKNGRARWIRYTCGCEVPDGEPYKRRTVPCERHRRALYEPPPEGA